MKRTLFVIAVLGFSGLLSYFSLFRSTEESAIRGDVGGIDLSDGSRYVPFETGAIGSESASLSGKSVTDEWYLRLSPIAWVSFISADAPVLRGKTVTVGKGVYFFRLGDIFQNLSVEHSDFRIKTLGHGNFYVDARDVKNIKIFSVSALLTVDLLSWKETVTTAHVFPSTFFGYVPAYNAELKNADILRVSTVNTLRYFDLKDPKEGNPVTGADKEALAFFRKNLELEKNQAKLFSKAYQTVFRLSEEVDDSDFAEDFGWYFVNDQKKSAILKGRLLRQIRNLAVSEKCEDSKKCQNTANGIAEIVETVSAMEEIDQELKSFAIAAIRQAYYLSYYEALARGDSYFESKTSNAFVTAVSKTTSGVSVEYGDYALLSEIHAAHYYGEKDGEKLDQYLNAYVKSLLNGKVIRKTEFLPFSFFLKEYLSREGFSISKTSLDLALSLVNVSNEYYETLSADSQRFSTLTVLYYAYSKIIDRIGKAASIEFLEQKDGATYVKSEYLDEAGGVDLPAGFAESFESFVKAFDTSYSRQQRELYSSFLKSASDKKASDTSTLLDKSLSWLKEQLFVFTDYGAYLQKISLDDATRWASGIIFEKEYPTPDEVKEYLSKFNGVDPSSVKIENDAKTDGYYSVKVSISGRDFSFELLPDEDYLVRNLVFSNGGETVETFRYTTVRLEEKREEYQKLLAALTQDNPRYQIYVFANYFVNTYLSERAASSSFDRPSDTGDDAGQSTEMDPATLVFVQQNLIQKDFKNVVSSFPISIANIEAKISDKTWDINLSGIRKTVNGQGGSYVLEFSGKYLFDQHSFYRMSVKSLDPSSFTPLYGGTSIQIMPRSVPLSEIGKRADSLYDYFQKLNSVVWSRIPSTIAVNLSSKKLIVDGVEYDVEETAN